MTPSRPTLVGVAALAATACLLTACGSPSATDDGAGGAAATTGASIAATATAAPTASSAAADRPVRQYPRTRRVAPSSGAEVGRLIAATELPAARTPVTTGGSLGGDAGTRRTARTTASTTTSYRVHMTIARARAWLLAHPPAGLPMANNLVAPSDIDPPAIELRYTAATATGRVASIDVSIAKAGAGTTIWRVTTTVTPGK